MSQAIKFHRVKAGNTPSGGWVKGHVYFIYDETGGTGSLKLVKDDNGTLEDYTQASSNSHNHSSNQVTAMTGYSKGSAGIDTSPIAATDSLNAAIGKLEYTVAGIETLLSNI